MKVSSVIPCKGCSPWRGLLFTASLLTCWHLSTTASARVIIELVPPQVVKGENVLLLVHNLPKNLIAFAWIKGVLRMNHAIAMYVPNGNVRIPGRQHTSRATIFSNGSLLLQDVNVKDTGLYTLQTYNRHAEIVSQTSVYISVHSVLWTCGRHDTYPRHTIESVPPEVPEGGNILLLIHDPPENSAVYIWLRWTTANRKVEIARYTLDRKLTEWGPAYTGRETLYSGGTLLIRGVTQEDHKPHTLRIINIYNESIEAHVQVQVYASLYTACKHVIPVKLMILAEPHNPTEGESIHLQVYNFPEDVQYFVWYKAKYMSQVLKIVEYRRAIHSFSWGPAHKRRGMIYNNGSLVLYGVTERDTGKYILSVFKRNTKSETAYFELKVKKFVTRPFVQVTETIVAGHTSVIFTCVSPDTDIFIRWIFNNQNLKLTERMTLSPTKCGLKIEPFRSEDAGEYQCEVSNQYSLQTSLPVSWPS